ncbi:MAG TPA: hypothetical protein VGI40_02705 [Pirellulaceae bacterium]
MSTSRHLLSGTPGTHHGVMNDGKHSPASSEDGKHSSAAGEDGKHSPAASGDGKHCPACGQDVGIWPVLMAGLPSWVRCPHCRARLSYGNTGLIITLLFALLLLLSGAAFYFARQHYHANDTRFFILLAVIVIALWLPIELAATLYLRWRGKLEKLL